MAGFTQEDIAKQLNMSVAMFNYCENGKRHFTSEREKLIMKILNKKLPDLKIEDVFPVNDEVK